MRLRSTVRKPEFAYKAIGARIQQYGAIPQWRRPVDFSAEEVPAAVATASTLDVEAARGAMLREDGLQYPDAELRSLLHEHRESLPLEHRKDERRCCLWWRLRTQALLCHQEGMLLI